MSYCGPIRGTCGRQETCLDEHCEGHPANLRWPTRRIDMDSAVLGARFSDGGHEVNGEDARPIRLDEPVTTPEQAGGWLRWVVITVLATTLAAAWRLAP